MLWLKRVKTVSMFWMQRWSINYNHQFIGSQVHVIIVWWYVSNNIRLGHQFMRPVYRGCLYGNYTKSPGCQIRQGPEYEWKLLSILSLLFILFETDDVLKQLLQVNWNQCSKVRERKVRSKISYRYQLLNFLFKYNFSRFQIVRENSENKILEKISGYTVLYLWNENI